MMVRKIFVSITILLYNILATQARICRGVRTNYFAICKFNTKQCSVDLSSTPTLTCRMEEALDIMLKLVSCGLFGFICYVLWIVCKLIVTAMICKHPELSDEKVKYITHMITEKQITKCIRHFNFLHLYYSLKRAIVLTLWLKQ